MGETRRRSSAAMGRIVSLDKLCFSFLSPFLICFFFSSVQRCRFIEFGSMQLQASLKVSFFFMFIMESFFCCCCCCCLCSSDARRPLCPFFFFILRWCFSFEFLEMMSAAYVFFFAVIVVVVFIEVHYR